MLEDPQKRRGFRAIIEGIVALAMVALAWWITNDGRMGAPDLREIARWALAIVGLGTMGYIMENGIRALKLRIGDVDIEADQGDSK